MYVTVLVHTQSQSPLLKVPARAVQPGNVVWLVEQGRLRKQRIAVLRRVNDGVLVDRDVSGFKEGARVVVSPLAVARDGLAVQEISGSPD
jgi:hypothetical protein